MAPIKKHISTSKKREYTIIAILTVLLLASFSYQFLQPQLFDQESKPETVYFALDLKDEKKAKLALQGFLTSLTSEFEKTIQTVDSTNPIISERSSKIIEKQKAIQKILDKKEITESELKQAWQMITSLNEEITKYKLENSNLVNKTDSLLVANKTLFTDKKAISKELDKEKDKVKKTENNFRSTFSISNYEIKGLMVKSGGKEVETDKAKRVDKLRISFDLDANKHTESGAKEIFITIYKPDGSLGKFKDSTPGEIETWSLGKVSYSDKIQFNYSNGIQQAITFDWEDFEFPKGVYRIELYQNGFKIGQKSLELR